MQHSQLRSLCHRDPLRVSKDKHFFICEIVFQRIWYTNKNQRKNSYHKLSALIVLISLSMTSSSKVNYIMSLFWLFYDIKSRIVMVYWLESFLSWRIPNGDITNASDIFAAASESHMTIITHKNESEIQRFFIGTMLYTILRMPALPRATTHVAAWQNHNSTRNGCKKDQ